MFEGLMSIIRQEDRHLVLLLIRIGSAIHLIIMKTLLLRRCLGHLNNGGSTVVDKLSYVAINISKIFSVDL